MIQYRAMQHYNWNLLEEEPLNPLLGRKMIHGQNVTVARIRLRKGAVVPMHSHPNEQISMLESGALRFTNAGGTWLLMRAPESMRTAVDVIPPEPEPLARITRRVKAALDPHGLMNPGRVL